jgi:hypothetical protein
MTAAELDAWVDADRTPAEPSRTEQAHDNLAEASRLLGEARNLLEDGNDASIGRAAAIARHLTRRAIEAVSVWRSILEGRISANEFNGDDRYWY